MHTPVDHTTSPATPGRLRALVRFRSWLAAGDAGPWVITLVFLLLLPFSVPRVALSDEVQYYAYLRSVYFDRDLDFRNEYEHFAAQAERFGDQAITRALLREDAMNPNPRTGLLRNVAPVGAAILWAPGFVLADMAVGLANALGANLPRDGYGRAYIVATCMMSALYSLLGLLLTYRLARRYSDDFAATVATLTVFLASSLVFYSIILMPWSHAPGFFLFALFLTVWMRHWRRPLERGLGTWMALGLIGGLMVMTREQLGLLLIIPALEALWTYGVLAAGSSGGPPLRTAPQRRDHQAAFVAEERWRAALGLAGRHAAFLVTLGVTLTPQLLAYQILNGRPGPSPTVASKFIWSSPNFLNTLIDPGRGAFVWAPVLALGLLGLLWLARRDALLAGLLLAGFLAQTYINGAFGTTWHLRGAFGFRRLIECTPIFVVGLATFLAWLQPRAGRWPILIGAVALVAWNIGLIAQFTFIRPEVIRRELVWNDMLYYQLVEVPRQVVEKLWTLLFDRCRLMTNQTC
ncbi:MAG: glycosyltransferase family 39 protein [Oscillochloridaceae bacterium]|nr:glycosyltransferase family 39 protein [Chloroflexaceae bacterium]MDW8390812.1 glycosyltransferase family 39 protein [Oscillochloridaceae bacterium]